jgi:putative ABC transport system ATP-binding protein
VNEPVLSLRDVTKAYPSAGEMFWALKGVSFEVDAGEMLALMGPSGSGKSTLMNILGLLDRQTGGRYLLNGTDVTDLTEDARAEARNQAIGFVFQAFHLLPRASLLENVEVPLTYAGWRARERRARAHALLERVGLGDKAGSTPSAISGGQKQRVAVARALAMSPALLLADEPTGNLDTATGNEIMGLFHDLNAEGATIVVVTHEPDIAAQAARTVVLRDGFIESDARQVPHLPFAKATMAQRSAT